MDATIDPETGWPVDPMTGIETVTVSSGSSSTDWSTILLWVAMLWLAKEAKLL